MMPHAAAYPRPFGDFVGAPLGAPTPAAGMLPYEQRANGTHGLPIERNGGGGMALWEGPKWNCASKKKKQAGQMSRAVKLK